MKRVLQRFIRRLLRLPIEPEILKELLELWESEPTEDEDKDDEDLKQLLSDLRAGSEDKSSF